MPVITVTLGTGATQTVQFDPTDTLQVLGGATTAAWTDVVDVSIGPDVEVPAGPGPAQVVVDPSAPEPPVATSGDPGDETTAPATEPTSSDTPVDVPVVDNSADLGTAVAPDAPVIAAAPGNTDPVDVPADTVGAALAAADAAAQATEPTEPTDPEPPPVSADGTLLVNLDDANTVADQQAHDAAVTTAQDAVDTGVAHAAPDGQAHLAQAITDVDQALATWPDSQPLLDAKAQLADLAADLQEENPAPAA